MSAFSVVMFLIPPVAIFFAIYNALRCYKKGAAPTKAMKIHFATLVAVTALCITGAMTALADTGDAAAAVTSNGDGLKYLAAGLCTGIAAIGGGIALGAGIPAAIGATSSSTSRPATVCSFSSLNSNSSIGLPNFAFDRKRRAERVFSTMK